LRVAGKIRNETGDGLLGAPAEGGGALRISDVEGSQAGAETGGIQLRDGEDADAALRASRSAEEPGTGAAGGVGNGGIDDLHKA
jgi:hypothetical protein